MPNIFKINTCIEVELQWNNQQHIIKIINNNLIEAEQMCNNKNSIKINYIKTI